MARAAVDVIGIVWRRSGTQRACNARRAWTPQFLLRINRDAPRQPPPPDRTKFLRVRGAGRVLK